MKRAFTLIEMMIVVAILVILMTIVFKLANLGQDSERRTRTIVRLQRLENCLSGYHAAFGSYPPVKLHGTRDIYMAAEDGQQDPDQRNENLWNWSRVGEENEARAWGQVKAACRSQPVDCRYPFPDEEYWNERVRDVCTLMKEYAHEECWEDLDEQTKKKIDGGFDSICENPGRIHNVNDIDWNNIKLFKFGLMSFLLPRYMIMTGGPQMFYSRYAQWTGNNQVPSDPFTGRTDYNGQGWSGVWQQGQLMKKGNSADIARLANIPSQAACARWIPNLEGICACNNDSLTLFGVNVKSGNGDDRSELYYKNIGIELYRPQGRQVGVEQYVLDGVTVKDGWVNEFYYYSPAPYQRYTLWSAGPNGRTFPPWISRRDLSSRANECVDKWVFDDIVHMAH